MKKLTITLISLLAFCVTMLAENTQTITIGGSIVYKNASVLTFDGSNVVLTYEDGTTQLAEMTSVSISIVYDNDASGISSIVIEDTANSNVYSVSGQYLGNSIDNLPKGLYIVNGKKIVIK